MISQEITRFIVGEVEANPNIYWAEIRGKVWDKFHETFDEDLLKQAYADFRWNRAESK